MISVVIKSVVGKQLSIMSFKMGHADVEKEACFFKAALVQFAPWRPQVAVKDNVDFGIFGVHYPLLAM